MLPYVNLGPLALPLPQLLVLAGLYFALDQLERWDAHFKTDGAVLYNLVTASLVAGLVGARLAFVLRYPAAFIESPLSLLSPNLGLFDLPGGLLVGLAVLLISAQRRAIPLWAMADALTPALAVFMVFLPLANLASGNGFGAPADLPWAIPLWNAARHPTQIYEALAAGMIVFLAWPARQALTQPDGSYFLKFVLLSAGARLLLEAFRGDSATLFGGLRTVQLIAFVVLAAGLAVRETRRSKHHHSMEHSANG